MAGKRTAAPRQRLALDPRWPKTAPNENTQPPQNALQKWPDSGAKKNKKLPPKITVAVGFPGELCETFKKTENRYGHFFVSAFSVSVFALAIGCPNSVGRGPCRLRPEQEARVPWLMHEGLKETFCGLSWNASGVLGGLEIQREKEQHIHACLFMFTKIHIYNSPC